MDIVLTGGTGFIGAAVLDRLVEAGHRVTAVVRSDGSAGVVEAQGATPEKGDLFDVGYLTDLFGRHDAVVHTAAGSDERDAEMTDAVIDAALAALGGTDKKIVATGGVWTHGSGSAITPDGPQDPPAITGWRVAREERLLTSGTNATVVRPGIVYGHGQGIPGALLGGPRDGDGALVLIGTGDQHWTTVHVDDLAELYVAALAAPAGTAYLGVGGDNPTVREVGEAAGPVVAGSADEAAERLGAPFAEALLLDQQADGAASRGLGWTPSRPSLVELVGRGYPQDA
jgi:nucleoside-diphosphate-sugar epimerase